MNMDKYMHLSDEVLRKAWNAEDTVEREEARKETLAYLEFGLENTRTMITYLEENKKQSERLMLEMDTTEEELQNLKDTLKAIERRITHERYMIGIVEEILVWYQRIWDKSPISEDDRNKMKLWLLEAIVNLEMIQEHMGKEVAEEQGNE